MVKIVSVEQMQAIEKATDAAGVSYGQMMQHAGLAVAEVVIEALGEVTSGQRVVILVGPGNNGGDGLVAARILAEKTDAEVSCYLLNARADDDEEYVAAVEAEVFIATAIDDQRWRVLKNLVGVADVIVDALLGTGARLPIEGELEKLLKHVATAMEHTGPTSLTGEPPGVVWPAAPVPVEDTTPLVVAVDCPSGLDCDTGEVDPAALRADVTVTFAAAKLGQLAYPGADYVGELMVAGIGTPLELAELAKVSLELATGQDVALLLPSRPSNAHKGTYGRALLIAGSVNYTGAAALAAEGAYRAGAGLVTLGVPQVIYPMLASMVREATWLLLPHTMGVINGDALDVLQDEAVEYDALLIGPGLGHEDDTGDFIQGIFRGGRHNRKGSLGFGGTRVENLDTEAGWAIGAPVIIDADGLNLLAQIDEWPSLLPDNAVVTPHPGEMSRLTGMDIEEVQARRVGIAAEKAAEWNCVVLLKGAYTVVAAPDGRVTVMPFAVDALASAGTGDVLSGVIVGLMAQGLAPYNAAIAGAYAHGLAGRLAGEEETSRSAMARDILEMLPAAFAQLTA